VLQVRYFGTDVLPREIEVRGLDVSEAKLLKQLERENTKVKKLVAEFSLDKRMLWEINKNSGGVVGSVACGG